MSIPGAASPLFIGAAVADAAAFQIDRSLRFNSGDTSYLTRTPSLASNRRTWTWSAWVKRSGIGTNDDIFKVSGSASKATEFRVQIHNGDYISIDYGGAFYLKTNRLLRDPSAWMHLVVAVDTTASTADNRIRLYINGSEETSFATRNNPNQNEELAINTASAHTLSTADSNGFDGYLTEVNFIDGQQLTPASFGELDSNNNWNPKAYSGTYGWFDNSQNWASFMSESSTSGNLFDADLTTFYGPSGNTCTFIPSSAITVSTSLEIWFKSSSASRNFEVNDSGTTIATGTSANGKWVDLNFTGSLTKISGTNGWNVGAIRIDGKILVAPGTAIADNSFKLNFSDNSSNKALGYDSSVTAPTLNPDAGFDVVTYTGNGGTQTISGLSFEPDFLWLKRRDGNNAHALFDSIRGVTKVLESSNDGAEKTNDPAIGSFDPNGFTVTGSSNQTNASSGSYVAWCWKAGGAAVPNSDGTIASSVSANTTYGFSIVKFTTSQD